jgi:methyl-accepting chemotaxis protein
MIGGYTDLTSKINETITLIEDVSSASKEQETGIVQINDAINALDRATQVNASSASEISGLSDGVTKLSADLTAISQRANFDKSKEKQICDIDLVFKISKIKNDHILFKDANFAKVGQKDVKAWSVTKHTDCNFGKWMAQEESKGTDFTKGSNWAKLKEYHECVHQRVQDYVNENANKAENEVLAKISKEVDDCTSKLFDCLDNIKIEYCTTYVEKKLEKSTPTLSNTNNSSKQTNKPQNLNTKSFEKYEKKTEVKKEVQKPKEFTSTTSDDEWESF